MWSCGHMFSSALGIPTAILRPVAEPWGQQRGLWLCPCGNEGYICILWCGEELLAVPRDGYAVMEVASWARTSPQRMK